MKKKPVPRKCDHLLPKVLWYLMLLVIGQGFSSLYASCVFPVNITSLDQTTPGRYFPYTLDTIPWFKKKKPVSEPKFTESHASSVLPPSDNLWYEYPCNVYFDGIDPVTGDRKKELSFEPLISYTPTHIKPYIPGQDILAAHSKFVRFSGGYTFLGIRFVWNARDPEQNYGGLKSNGAIQFVLTDNKKVTLFHQEEYTWIYNKEEGHYEINALYMLHPKQIKLFQRHALIKMTVYWEKGFEEYSVYPILLFQDQLRCLD